MTDLDYPTPERQKKILDARQQGDRPYDKVLIHTLGEFNWILEIEGWKADGSVDNKRADFQGARFQGDFTGIYIRKADFRQADFSGSRLNKGFLEGANLEGACFRETEFIGTNLESANFKYALFSRSHLEDAYLASADFRHARIDETHFDYAFLESADFTQTLIFNSFLSHAFLKRAKLKRSVLWDNSLNYAVLVEANLDEAQLKSVNLSHADLTRSHMSKDTILKDVRLQRAKLSEVDWNDVRLIGVKWNEVDVLGDEPNIELLKREVDSEYRITSVINNKQRRRIARQQEKTRNERYTKRRIQAYQKAIQAYRSLSIELRKQGLILEASKFRYREQNMARTLQLYTHNWGGGIVLSLLDLVAGYGEKPGRVLKVYLTTVLGFTAVYTAIDLIMYDKIEKNPFDLLVLSITAFHGRGFFPAILPYDQFTLGAGLVEAIFGLFIELTFIATFTRRFLGS